jgi:hypothetical protein
LILVITKQLFIFLDLSNICNSFPYSEKNQPCSNSTIPIYYRKQNTFIDFKNFPDCVDIVTLHICNCLFYDPIKQCYSTEGLNVSKDLLLFYEKHNTLFSITNETRKEWSKVIQSLDEFIDIDSSEYKTHKIVYLKEHRNEFQWT